MVNKTPLADLPSIDEFIVEPEELPSIAEFLEEEVVEEDTLQRTDIQTIEDADGNSFLEIEDVIKAPEWGELVRMVNDVRNDIPEIPEIKDYEPQLEEISATIQQVKQEIPIVPEVRYYEDELQALRETISKVEESIPSLPAWIHKVTEVPDFAWVGKGFNVIDEDFRVVRDSVSTLGNRIEQELEKIHEESNTKEFETKTDFKTIHERVNIVREDIFKQLKEQSSVIWNLQKKLKANQKEFEIAFNENLGEKFDVFQDVTKKTVEGLQESFTDSTTTLAHYMDNEVKSLQERIKTLPKPKYYEQELKNINKELKNLTELKALVYDIKTKQKVLEEGYLLSEPPNQGENIGSGEDPLTPMDQNFATHEDLAKHYKIFINRIQTQLATMGGGGAGFIKDLDDVTFDESTGTNKLLIYSGSGWVGIASTALAPAAETLDQTLKQGNTSAMGMNVSGITSLSNTTNSTAFNSGALIVSGGVGIAKSLTVKGNISCAGTVYYEDVTNIDSVGIVTANNNIEVSGIVTAVAGAAVTYYGDGSNLSGKASIGLVLALG